MPTLNVGRRREVVLPKKLCDELAITPGSKIDVSVANNVMTIVRSLRTRTKMDDDFDRVRDSYLADGVTLEDMMKTLAEIRANNE
jgi:antitoxin component of MazEF toxin-antitoxin module